MTKLPTEVIVAVSAMKRLLGAHLRELRAARSRVQFAKLLGLSYTFVREMELGNRLPSDEVLLALADKLHADHRRLLIYTYCDRSPALRKVLGAPEFAFLMAAVPSAEESESS